MVEWINCATYGADSWLGGYHPFSRGEFGLHFDYSGPGERDSREVFAECFLLRAITTWNHVEINYINAMNDFMTRDSDCFVWVLYRRIRDAEAQQNQALVCLGRGLHAIQDFHGHGQISAGGNLGHAAATTHNFFARTTQVIANIVTLGMWSQAVTINFQPDPDSIYYDWYPDGTYARLIRIDDLNESVRLNNTRSATERYLHLFALFTNTGPLAHLTSAGSAGSGFESNFHTRGVTCG